MSGPRKTLMQPSPPAELAAPLRRCAAAATGWSETMMPVAARDDPRAVLSDVLLVGDEQHRDAALDVQPLKDPHYFDAGARVEVAGRLVGEQDRRPGDERARDRHALLLTAGQLVRVVIGPLAEADRARAPPSRACAARRLHACRRCRAAAARRCRARVVRDSRLKPWNTKPIFLFRTSASWSLDICETSWPSRKYWPEVGRSRQPRMCISVDLPEPDGPVTATNSPRLNVERHAAQRPHLHLADDVGLDEVA